MGELHVLIFVKIDQRCSKIPLASDFIAISGFVGSTTSLVDGFYVPHMVLNMSYSISKVMQCRFELFMNQSEQKYIIFMISRNCVIGGSVFLAITQKVKD